MDIISISHVRKTGLRDIKWLVQTHWVESEFEYMSDSKDYVLKFMLHYILIKIWEISLMKTKVKHLALFSPGK